MTLPPGKKCLLFHGPADSVGFPSPLEKDGGRYTPDIEPGGKLGILFGIALTVNYADPGMGLAMLWTAAVLGVIGGIVLIVQAFRQRSAK